MNDEQSPNTETHKTFQNRSWSQTVLITEDGVQKKNTAITMRFYLASGRLLHHPYISSCT